MSSRYLTVYYLFLVNFFSGCTLQDVVIVIVVVIIIIITIHSIYVPIIIISAYNFIIFITIHLLYTVNTMLYIGIANRIRPKTALNVHATIFGLQYKTSMRPIVASYIVSYNIMYTWTRWFAVENSSGRHVQEHRILRGERNPRRPWRRGPRVSPQLATRLCV